MEEKRFPHPLDTKIPFPTMWPDHHILVQFLRTDILASIHFRYVIRHYGLPTTRFKPFLLRRTIFSW
ncbi:hypothetical protein Poly24_53740 [Rosistilla carotiformis]|uniref:Uncharacterized protein n=1 Tax=Rosistilla carotiformis TaxID=2528017 RepID=A0A518K1J7_9BACT|nr:hypothetical protein Poly24_53740 [Rosistilla carotiformis]